MFRRAVISAVLLVAFVLPALPAIAGPRVPSQATRGPWVSGSVEAARVTSAAFSISRHDGNDVRGDLDLRSMRISRGKAKDTIAFTTHEAVSNAAIDVDNGNFAVLIDTNDNRKFDFGQYVFFAAGQLRGVLVNLRTDRVVDRTMPVSRSSATGFRTTIVRSKIHSPGTYRFVVFGYTQANPCTARKPCIDTIPNRFPMIPLDHQAPTIDAKVVRFFAAEATEDLTMPVRFSVEDDKFGSGVRRWVLERRRSGETAWVEVQRGRALDAIADLTGVEGARYDLRVSIFDRQDNVEVSQVQQTVFPIDDRNGMVTYSGTSVQNAAAEAFLSTTTGLSQDARASIAFEGAGQACVMTGPLATGLTSHALVEIDGIVRSGLNESDFGQPRGQTCYGINDPGPHTLAIVGDHSTPFVIEGFYVVT